MANRPNTHVIPSRGTTIIAALINDLLKGVKKTEMYFFNKINNKIKA